MWSISRLTAAATVIFVSGAAADVAEPTGQKELTAEIEKICAQAEDRYKKVFPDAQDAPDVVVVKLYKYNFCPPNITVKAGTTVKWVNVDRRTSHSVWLKQAGEEESERFFPEELWSFQFTEPGSYPYLCGPHWQQENMHGHVTVMP